MPSPNTPSPPVCPGTLRIWVIGFYIVEYEQEGKDRAAYGKRLLETIAKRLSDRGVKGLSLRPLRSCRAFYLTFPQIRLTVSAEFNLIENVSNKMNLRKLETKPDIALIDPKILLSKLNFSHFEELLKLDTPLQRTFYEVQAIRNNWGVRDLRRAINSMLFERTGLSTDKAAVLEH